MRGDVLLGFHVFGVCVYLSVIQCPFGSFILKNIKNSDDKSVSMFFYSLLACVSVAIGTTDKGSLLRHHH